MKKTAGDDKRPNMVIEPENYGQDDAETMQDKNHLNYHYKTNKTKQEFEDTVRDLTKQIKTLKERVNNVHMKMNARNATIVGDITHEIEDIVHAVFYDNEIDAAKP